MASAKQKGNKKNLGKNGNLKPQIWKPGQSGNPKGRAPKALSVTSVLKEILEWPAPTSIIQTYRQFFPNLPANPTCIQILTVRSLVKAMDIKQGDVMAKEIWDRLDGKVPFPVTGSKDGEPIGVKFDFSSMSAKELDIFERLLGKCQTEENPNQTV